MTKDNLLYDFYYYDVEEDQIRGYRDNNEEFLANFKKFSLDFARTASQQPKKKFNGESESFTPLAIRQYEAKANTPDTNLSMEDRFLIKTSEQARKDKKKLKKGGKKKGPAEKEMNPKTRVYNSSEYETK